MIAGVEGFFHYKCDSLRQYAISLWGLPEYTAADLVTVAMARPQDVPESLTYRGDDLIELRTGVSEKTMENLERIKDLLSQREKRSVTLAEALAVMAEITLNKLDPLRKAERAEERDKSKVGTCQETKKEFRKSGRRVARAKIPRHVTHAVNLRDQGRCTQVNNQGERCQMRRWVHSRNSLLQ